MAYSDSTLVRTKWGTANIDKWADLNNNGNSTEIEARIADAISEADLEIDSRLRGGGYVIPFPVVPEEIRHASARLAGVILYEPRRFDEIEDNDNTIPNNPVFAVKKRLMEWLREIRAGVIQLSIPNLATNYPAVTDARYEYLDARIVPRPSQWILDNEITTVLFASA